LLIQYLSPYEDIIFLILSIDPLAEKAVVNFNQLMKKFGKKKDINDDGPGK
jgi:hypothetical protein